MDSLLMPPTQTGTSDAASSVVGSGRSSISLVEDPFYRDMNLAANNIYLRPFREHFPHHIASLIRHIGRDRDSPGLSLDKVRDDARLNGLWTGSAESIVEEYFHTHIFSNPQPSDNLERAIKIPMAKRVVPNIRSDLKVSKPVPDMLYGYNREAFLQQQAQLLSMGTEMVANSLGLLYPFFVIEFKGDGSSGRGSLWEATNQCLGGSASCTSIAERLNRRLEESKVQLINSATFSVAMNGTEARLYISWKHDKLNYHIQGIECFLLQRPDHYLEFYKHVQNIIDWGKDTRLKQIQESLDRLEKDRKRSSR
jgi:hypothetical protein